MDIAVRLRIVDLFFLIVLLRMGYIAASRGWFFEISKVFGLLSASFLAFNFYPGLAESIAAEVKFIRPGWFYPFAFFFVFVAVSLVFSLLNLIVGLFLPKKEIPAKKKLVLLLVGFFRAVFFASTLFFFSHLTVFSPGYKENSLSYSLSKKTAPGFYLFSSGLIKRFRKDFQVNDKVRDYLKQDEPCFQEATEI